MSKAHRLSVAALIMSVSMILAGPWPPTKTGPIPDLACRSLAALYARRPEYFDAQDVAALHACIGTAQAEVVPVPTPMQPAARTQRVDRFRGDWPESAPWTTPPNPFPYPTMW